MNNSSRYIILNWMLPAIPSFPSPAMSLLKSQLQTTGFDVKVVYWNFKLMPLIEHYWGRTTEDYEDHLIYYLSPIFAYWAIELEDDNAICLMREYWNKNNKGEEKSKDAFKAHIIESVSMLKSIVSSVLQEYHYDKCLFAGYYQKLFQMYGADIVSREQKRLYPNSTAVLGGIDTKDEALASMDNFPAFDYALWGEGEITLQNLASMLRGQMDVGNLAWREAEGVMLSKANRSFVTLDDSVIPDYGDYFEQAVIDKSKIRLPIEGSRGCHWARCRFCFHNEGTRYRRKSPKRIASEIRHQIEKYGIRQISFLDNDTIGRNVDGFRELLNELAAIKRDYPDFYISRAEVVTRSLDAELVRQMATVGFKDVQVGYESLSDHLLEKIHKCNSFSSNFLFIKWALLSGIKIRGANLIMNLLEETDADLHESLENLRFLRFMLKDMKFMHVYSTLWIKHSSRYFKEIVASGRLDEWKVFKSFRFLPSNYLKDKNKYALQFFVKPTFNPLWDDIEEKEWEYIRHPHTYMITENDEGVKYDEYRDGENIISENLTQTDWCVLCAANENVVSLDGLKQLFPNVIEVDLKTALNRLKQFGILYYSDYCNVVTIINTKCKRNEQQRYT